MVTLNPLLNGEKPPVTLMVRVNEALGLLLRHQDQWHSLTFSVSVWMSVSVRLLIPLSICDCDCAALFWSSLATWCELHIGNVLALSAYGIAMSEGQREWTLNSPELTKGIPSNGTYCDFHMRRVDVLAGLGDWRVPQKLCVCCLW